MTEPNIPEAGDHYFTAEQWIHAVSDMRGRKLRRYRAECIARAQVHATLAVAAAAIWREQRKSSASREAS